MIEMRTAIYHYPSLTIGGDTFIFDMASSLVNHGYAVDTITSNQLPLTGGKRNLTTEDIVQRLGGGLLHEFPFIKIFPRLNSLRKIRAILNRCDILYIKNELFELFQLEILKLKTDTPTVCGVHTAIFYPYSPSLRAKAHNALYMNKIYGDLLRRCDAIHVLNSFDSDLIKSCFNIEESKIFLIPLGVDTNEFYPKDVIRNNDKLKVIFLNKLDEQKGFDTFCNAILYLRGRADFNQMVFTIVGSGKWKDLAEDLARTHSNVRYLGFVPQEAIVDIYNSHDVLVLPSRWETLSYVCLEAQSCGVPVIATNIPGPNSIIKHGKTGFLIRPEESISLANAILRMHQIKRDSPHIFNEMKKSCRQNILERFSLEIEVKKITALFDFVSAH